MSISSQTFALFLKNILINLRNKVDLAREFLFPLIIISVIIIKQSSNFFSSLFLPFYLPLTILGLLRKILIDLVLEKSNRYKESFKIMGLRQISFIMSWMATFYAVGLLIEGVLLGVMKIGGLFDPLQNVEKFFGSYFLFLGSSVQFCFCLTSLFSDPKKSIKFGSVILGGTSFIYFISTYVEMPIFVVYLLSLFPNANLALTFMSLKPSHPYNKDFNVDIALGIQGFNFIFYFLLYFYLEEVVQNEYGVSKSLCFCWNGIFSNKNRTGISLEDGPSKNLNISLSLTSKEINHPEIALQITNLTRSFNKKKAVDNLSFSILEGELFCLLGHNGAGKSTTINLLTGMLKPDSGKIKFFGMDYELNLEIIRRKMGFCPQSDILYDYLSLQEHIQLIGKIKDIKIEGSEEITHLLDRLEISNLKSKFAKNLSLGNKRKLSLAMSILGDSKIIFLDEPTSGMDPGSRRVVWQILRELKQKKKSIIFTTHHLDEAEELADRIAVLSTGKILILDTVESVKRKFGMGYILTVSSSNEASTDSKNQAIEKENIFEISDPKLDALKSTKNNEKISLDYFSDPNLLKTLPIIKNLIPSANLIESQTTTTSLKILLPFDSQPLLGVLFKNLEEISGLVMSLDLNSLEDAFINMGKNIEEAPKKEKEILKEEFLTEREDLIKRESDIIETIQERRVWMRQALAAFIRRFLLLTNDLASSFMIYIMHMIYLIVVVLTAKFGIKYYAELSEDEKTQYSSRIILSAYIFLSTIFLGHHVTERENSVKYVLLVMGMRPSAYWLGNFLFDILVFGSSLAVLLSLLAGLEMFEGVYGEFAGLLTAFGFSLILFAYLFSFVFKSYHSATHIFPLVVLSTFGIPYLIIYLFTEGIFPENPTKAEDSRKTWEAIFLFLAPLYTCERGLSLLNPTEKQSSSYLIPNTSLVALILLIQGLLWAIGIFLIENKGVFKLKEKRKLQSQKKMMEGARERLLKDIDYNLDPSQHLLESDLIDINSLIAEKKRLERFNREDILKIFNLKKQYSADNQLVLKGVDFCVSEGEVFGLLGPNGAGKTTTFNILTSLIEKDGGLVILNNMISSLIEKNLFQNLRIGICPQNNCLFENLNVFHHFLVFGLMKGMLIKEIKIEYDYLTQGLGLTPFLKTKAMHLSGGNKRKLCLALALLSSPKILFLDEPSTGIDPISKRSMWTLLKKRFRDSKSSVVLTTHSMNEAEFLSTKVGILINGSFYTINSLQSLKAHYSDGYRLILKINENKRNHRKMLEKQLWENFEVCQNIKLSHPTKLEEENKLEELEIFRVGGEKFSMSSCCQFVFEKLVKEMEIVEDFGVSYCTLEQIFLRLVNGEKKN